ncbi:hypothetical protein TNCV_4364951 [Trichonephila clavipes]|nr:hypothetical protein TNCV_4364951 [Trichonephila clavipes]
MEIAEMKRRTDFEQRMRDIEMEFETQKKLIELEGEAVRPDSHKAEVEDRLKADEEAKAVKEGRKMEEEGRKNEIIALEVEMRLKKERWLVEEQMRHVQEEHKTSMKEERKCTRRKMQKNERSKSVVN